MHLNLSQRATRWGGYMRIASPTTVQPLHDPGLGNTKGKVLIPMGAIPCISRVLSKLTIKMQARMMHASQ